MVRPKLINNGASGLSHLSGVLVVVYLIIGWARPAFSVEPTAASDEQPHLQLAPIRFSYHTGGNIGYVFQRSATGPEVYSTQSLGVGVHTNVRVSSFFWQPWLALVNSNLSVSFYSSSSSSSTTPFYSTLNTNTNGDASLKVLAGSRFPFTARIYRQENKSLAFYSGTNSDNQLTGYSLNQDYKSLNRRTIGTVSFSSNKSGGLNSSPSYTDTFGLSVMQQIARGQSITISGNKDHQNQPGLGQSSSFDTLLFNHVYQPNTIFSVASFANFLKMNNELVQGGSVITQSQANSKQFSSFASLRPERTPLTMTTSIRLSEFDSSTTSQAAPTLTSPTLTSSNFNLGANYLFSPLIRMYGSVNVADTLGIQTTSTNAALAGAKAYSSSTNIGGFRYTGSIGGSVSSSTNISSNSGTGTQTTSQSQGLGLYLSHALDKTRKFGEGSLSKNLHQTITTAVSSKGNSSSSLASGGALSWVRSEGKETTQFRLSANDSRNLNGVQRTFQMINLQATRNEAISHNESLIGSMTVQASRFTQNNISSNTITPNATMSYTNKRTFNVLRLQFDSILRISDTNIGPPQTYSPDVATRTWENNFSYKIGVLTLLLNTRLALLNNVTQSLIVFTMSRPF